MVRQEGTIIIWTSIFLLLFAMLMTLSLQGFHIDIKLVNQDEVLQKTFYSAEAALRKGENQVIKRQTSSCQVPKRDFNYYPQMNAQWWKTKPNCSIDLNGMMSYYVIEDIGIEPCILLVDGDGLIKNDVSVAHFYRVSASTQTQMHQLMILQSTMIVAETMVNACDQERFQVASKGRQSWREVYLS